MEYGKMISVSGLSGLFELVGSKKDGAIVRSLEDKSTRFVASRVHNFSHLESIEVYTHGENVNLVDVFKAMEASSEALPNDKDAAAIKAYFEKVYPDMDFEKVYASDMKKMIKWYTSLKANEVEIKLSETEEDSEDESNEDIVAAAASVTDTVIPEAEKKEVDLKPEAAPATEEPPKKKTTRKKKTEE